MERDWYRYVIIIFRPPGTAGTLLVRKSWIPGYLAVNEPKEEIVRLVMYIWLRRC